MIVDASALYAFFVRSSDDHWAITGEIEISAGEELTVMPFSLMELESLVSSEFGLEGWVAVLAELGSGAWVMASMDAGHLDAVKELVEKGWATAAASVAAHAESAGLPILSLKAEHRADEQGEQGG